MEGSKKRCCVPNCNATAILHNFPNPVKQKDRFILWLRAIGKEKKWAMDHKFVHKCRAVCDIHFEHKYVTRFNRLSINAVPTLFLQGLPDIDQTSTPQDNNSGEAEFIKDEECNSNTESADNNISPTTSAEYGPNIHKDVASSFEHIAITGLDEETRKALIKEHSIPSNCTAIHAPSLTPEIKATITDQVLKQDEAIEAKQQQLAAAISSLGRIISDQLMNKDIKNPDLVKQLMATGHLLCDLQYLESLARYNNINSSES